MPYTLDELNEQFQILNQRMARLATTTMVQNLATDVAAYKSEADTADSEIVARLDTIEAQITDILRRLNDLEA